MNFPFDIPMLINIAYQHGTLPPLKQKMFARIFPFGIVIVYIDMLAINVKYRCSHDDVLIFLTSPNLPR